MKMEDDMIVSETFDYLTFFSQSIFKYNIDDKRFNLTINEQYDKKFDRRGILPSSDYQMCLVQPIYYNRAIIGYVIPLNILTTGENLFLSYLFPTFEEAHEGMLFFIRQIKDRQAGMIREAREEKQRFQKDLISTMKQLVDLIMYAPGGKGTQEAQTHFENMQKGESTDDKTEIRDKLGS